MSSLYSVGCNERKPNITAEYRKTFQQYQQSQQNQQKTEQEYGNFVSELITQIDELITQQNDLQKQLQEERQTKYAVLEDNRILQSENDKLKKDHSDDFATQRHLEKQVAELKEKNRIRDLMEKIREPLTYIIGTMDIQNNKAQRVYYNDLLRAFDSVGIHIIYYKEGDTIPDKAPVESYPKTTDNPTLNEKVVLMEKMGCTFDFGEPEIRARVTQYKYEKPKANEVPKKPVGQSSAVPPTSPTQNEKPKANEVLKKPVGLFSAVPPTSPVQTGKPNEQSFVSGDDVYLQSITDPQKRFYFLQKGKTYRIAENIPIKNILSGVSVGEQYYIMCNTKLVSTTPYSQIELYSNSFYSLTKGENGFRIMFSIYDKGKAKPLVFPITLQEPKKEETKVEAFTPESFVSGDDVYFQSGQNAEKYYILKKGKTYRIAEKIPIKNILSGASPIEQYYIMSNTKLVSTTPYSLIELFSNSLYSLTKGEDGFRIMFSIYDKGKGKAKALVFPITLQEPKKEETKVEAFTSESFVSGVDVYFQSEHHDEKFYILKKGEKSQTIEKSSLKKLFSNAIATDNFFLVYNGQKSDKPLTYITIVDKLWYSITKKDGSYVLILGTDQSLTEYKITLFTKQEPKVEPKIEKPVAESFVSDDDVYWQSATDPNKKYYVLQKGKQYHLADRIDLKDIINFTTHGDRYYLVHDTAVVAGFFSEDDLMKSFYSLTKEKGILRMRFVTLNRIFDVTL